MVAVIRILDLFGSDEIVCQREIVFLTLELQEKTTPNRAAVVEKCVRNILHPENRRVLRWRERAASINFHIARIAQVEGAAGLVADLDMAQADAAGIPDEETGLQHFVYPIRHLWIFRFRSTS